MEDSHTFERVASQKIKGQSSESGVVLLFSCGDRWQQRSESGRAFLRASASDVGQTAQHGTAGWLGAAESGRSEGEAGLGGALWWANEIIGLAFLPEAFICGKNFLRNRQDCVDQRKA